jgi:hypothetical protein
MLRTFFVSEIIRGGTPPYSVNSTRRRIVPATCDLTGLAGADAAGQTGSIEIPSIRPKRAPDG